MLVVQAHVGGMQDSKPSTWFERTISSEKDRNQGQVVVQGVYQSAKCSSIKPIKVYFFSIVVGVLFFLVTVVEKCTFCLRQPSQF